MSPVSSEPGRTEVPVASEITEERDFLLRSLHDLEAEHAAGDIDDLDYQTLKDDYTTRAAAALRALAAPLEPEAEREGEATIEPAAVASAGTGWLGRHRKMVVSVAAAVIVVAGTSWAVVASSSHREAGEEITGLGVGSASETKLLLAAQQAANKGDTVTELKDAQSILQSDPTQPQALVMEGWLLAQTNQKALLAKGIGLLSLAEQVDPSFAEAHVYRGIAFLSEGNNRQAVPELKWYLAHHPDPKLAPKVRTALAKAEAALAGEP